MRHIHTTVGAVVSCHTFQRGSGWLTLSNVSRRVGRPKEQAQTDLCRAIADRTVKIRCKLKRHTTRHITSKAVLEGKDFQIPTEIKPEDLDWERSRPLKPWFVRRGSFSATGILGSGVDRGLQGRRYESFVRRQGARRDTQHASSETPATSTSRPALESQEMPVGSGPRSTAGPRKPGAAGPGRRRGARPQKFEQTKDAMRNDIQQGRLTVAQLENMLEKNLATNYGVSRDTARKARNAVLSELNSRQIPTNDK